ncbi:AraC family transcriptional regulator [Paenibacillus sp. HB172176]|uniref:AraC family transcriptional regulator n=1 Tax=Paenibacillus sp. HB172176 TaxID=2493690 RepID=UPI00143BEDBF|nr:AraC family transcriptional regulator [Paenibacillus sp. HB172176]
MIKPSDMMRQLNQMNFKVSLAGHKKQEPSLPSGPYTHRFNSMWMISRGKGVFTIDGHEHIAEPGKLFVISPGMIISRMADEEQPLEYYFIRFQYATHYEENGEWLSGAGDDTPFPLIGAYTIQNPPALLNNCEQLCLLMKRRGQIIMMRQRILFLDILLQIISDLRSQIVSSDTNVVIENTIDYMVNHYNENITVEELAKLAGLSVSHYTRLFKKYVNNSPIHYLTQLRMDRAKELLTLSDYKLKALAQSIGYSDELYFSRLFKKFVGISPSQYAKLHKSAPGKA